MQVITIEPGVYIPPSPVLNERAPGRFRGIGIRIEDEVLVTEDGHEVRTRVWLFLLCPLGRWVPVNVAGHSPPG
jgi:Xaa-Pro aminopeptidase